MKTKQFAVVSGLLLVASATAMFAVASDDGVEPCAGWAAPPETCLTTVDKGFMCGSMPRLHNDCPNILGNDFVKQDAEPISRGRKDSTNEPKVCQIKQANKVNGVCTYLENFRDINRTNSIAAGAACPSGGGSTGCDPM